MSIKTPPDLPGDLLYHLTMLSVREVLMMIPTCICAQLRSKGFLAKLGVSQLGLGSLNEER